MSWPASSRAIPAVAWPGMQVRPDRQQFFAAQAGFLIVYPSGQSQHKGTKSKRLRFLFQFCGSGKVFYGR